MINLNVYHFIGDYKKGEIKNLDKKINIIYRNYNKPINEREIINIRNECRKANKKFYISNNFKLAIKLKLNGIYIPSFNKSLKVKFNYNKKIDVLGSAHNLKEIRIKEKQGVNKIFLSPLFRVNKVNNFLGIKKFNFLSELTNKKIIALGGINEKNINKIKMLRCDGYAAIKYLINKKKINDIRK